MTATFNLILVIAPAIAIAFCGFGAYIGFPAARALRSGELDASARRVALRDRAFGQFFFALGVLMGVAVICARST